MKIFLDTADLAEIQTAARWGVLNGVTTNPTLFAKEAEESYVSLLRKVCALTQGLVSAEVVAEDLEGMLVQAHAFAAIAPNIVVKIPMGEIGLEAIARLRTENIATNCTLVFSANQGLLAANAGAALVSPFIGRLNDINEDGMAVVRELAEVFSRSNSAAQILAASIRDPFQVTQAALAGAHSATVPFRVLKQMVHHPLTETGTAQFREDWKWAQRRVGERPGDGSVTSVTGFA